MSGVLHSAGRHVYRDRRLSLPFISVPFGAGGVMVLVSQIPEVLAKGGLVMHNENNGTASFWPMPWALLFVIAFSLPFLSLFVFMWLYYFNNQIIVDDEGLSSINLFGREDFRARWDKIESVYEAKAGNGTPLTKISGYGGTLNLQNGHPAFMLILAAVQEHTGKAPSELATRLGGRASVSTEFGEASQVRPERVFRYRFPLFTVLAVLPLFGFGVFFAAQFPSSGDLLPNLPFFAFGFGLPAALILGTAVSAANARVVMAPDRLTIVDGLGREVFSSPWTSIRGLYCQGSSSNGGRGVNPLGAYRTYAVESENGKGKIRSSLGHFDECLKEMRARMPSDAIFVE